MATALKDPRLDKLRELRDAIEDFENTVERIVSEMPLGYAKNAVPEILQSLDIMTSDGLVELAGAIQDLGYSS